MALTARRSGGLESPVAGSLASMDHLAPPVSAAAAAAVDVLMSLGGVQDSSRDCPSPRQVSDDTGGQNVSVSTRLRRSNSSCSDGSVEQSSGGGVVRSGGSAAPKRKRDAYLYCSCKNSRCLKLYCECFKMSQFCMASCSCKDCHNTTEHVVERSEAVRAALDRNPSAFEAKVSPIDEHNVGCVCRKSRCLKKYCECFKAGIHCAEKCKCLDCENRDDGSEGGTPRLAASGAVPATTLRDDETANAIAAIAASVGGPTKVVEIEW